MKRIAIALLLVMIATTAQATTIEDMQTGLVTIGDAVTLSGVVVTAARYNGVYVAEAPYGTYQQIWVYTGTDPMAVPGDMVDVAGTYAEYYDLSEVDGGTVSVVGSAVIPAPIVVPAATLVADGEPYESCIISIPDMMTVTAINSYGEWEVTALDGSVMIFDDFWFDDTTVALGDCYSNVTGALTYSYGAFKVEPFVDGITGCPVENESVSFGTMKSLYR